MISKGFPGRQSVPFRLQHAVFQPGFQFPIMPFGIEMCGLLYEIAFLHNAFGAYVFRQTAGGKAINIVLSKSKFQNLSEGFCSIPPAPEFWVNKITCP